MTEYQIADCRKVLENFAENTQDEHLDNPVGWYRHRVIEASEEIHRILSST